MKKRNNTIKKQIGGLLVKHKNTLNIGLISVAGIALIMSGLSLLAIIIGVFAVSDFIISQSTYAFIIAILIFALSIFSFGKLNIKKESKGSNNEKTK